MKRRLFLASGPLFLALLLVVVLAGHLGAQGPGFDYTYDFESGVEGWEWLPIRCVLETSPYSEVAYCNPRSSSNDGWWRLNSEALAGTVGAGSEPMTLYGLEFEAYYWNTSSVKTWRVTVYYEDTTTTVYEVDPVPGVPTHYDVPVLEKPLRGPDEIVVQFDALHNGSDVGQFLAVDNIRFLGYWGSPTATPTASPTVTPSPSPTSDPYSGGYGLQCENEILEEIDATLINNGSWEFDDGVYGEDWTGNDFGLADVSTDGPPYSRVGTNSLLKFYYLTQGTESSVYQYIFAPAYNVDWLELGYSVRGTETCEGDCSRDVWLELQGIEIPGTRQTVPSGEGVWSWVDVEDITYDWGGGSARFDVMVGPGEGGVYVDAVYAYPWSETLGEIVCVGPDLEPTPTSTPLGTLPPLPTLPWGGTGTPQPTIDPIIEIDPQPTACYVWDPEDIPVVGSVPSAELCIGNDQVTIPEDHPLNDFFPLKSFVETGFIAGLVLFVLAWIRSR